MALEVVIEIRWVQTPYPLINTEKTAYWCFRKGFKGKNYTVGDDRANDMRLQRDFSTIIFIEAVLPLARNVPMI